MYISSHLSSFVINITFPKKTLSDLATEALRPDLKPSAIAWPFLHMGYRGRWRGLWGFNGFGGGGSPKNWDVLKVTWGCRINLNECLEMHEEGRLSSLIEVVGGTIIEAPKYWAKHNTPVPCWVVIPSFFRLFIYIFSISQKLHGDTASFIGRTTHPSVFPTQASERTNGTVVGDDIGWYMLLVGAAPKWLVTCLKYYPRVWIYTKEAFWREEENTVQNDWIICT